MLPDNKKMKIYIVLTLCVLAATLTLPSFEQSPVIVGGYQDINVTNLTPEQKRIDGFIKSNIGGKSQLLEAK